MAFTIRGMHRTFRTPRWDAIENTAGDVVVIVPPMPLPLAMVVTEDGVDVATAGSILRLEESAALREVILRARTVVVAEADERIVRETLVPTFRTKPKPASEQQNDLQAA